VENPQNPNPGDAQPRTLSALQAGGVAAQLNVIPGYGSLAAFELLQRQAKALTLSTLVPTAYQAVIIKYDRNGDIKEQRDNPNAVPNTMIALNMATRMGADPVMVMQNLYIVEGRPSWSSQWVIAQINNCGRFEPLRFDIVEKGEIPVEYEHTEWEDAPTAANPNRRLPKRSTKTIKVENIEGIAWTVPKGTKIPQGVITYEDAKKAGLPVLKGPKVSVAMAVKEGWYTKTGSKWQTIPELMLHYRCGAFFGRLYAPELLMGFPTHEEVQDTMGVLTPSADGSYTDSGQTTTTPAPGPDRTTVADLQKRAAAPAASEAPTDAQPRTAGEPAATADAETQGDKAADAPAATPAPGPAPASSQAPVQQQTGGDSLFANTD
jgi:hypothetical protein